MYRQAQQDNRGEFKLSKGNAAKGLRTRLKGTLEHNVFGWQNAAYLARGSNLETLCTKVASVRIRHTTIVHGT